VVFRYLLDQLIQKSNFGENKMKMTKNILLFLCLVFVASTVEAKIIKDSVYQIPKTKVAPVIDGKQDAIWKALDWNMMRLYNVGDPPTATSGADSGVGLTGMSKIMWDATNIYYLFYTVDDVIADIPANPGWNQDAIEIYIDRANDHTTETALKAGQYQFTIPHWMKGTEVGRLGSVFGTTFDTAGCAFKIADVIDTEGFPGWMTEIKIPLASLGIDGSSADNQKIGFELQQDESDLVSAGRQSMSKWWSSSNNSWANAGIWGYAVLSDRVVDTVFEMSKLPAGTTITVDGTMDPIYKQGNAVTTNLFRVGDPPGTDAADTDPMFGGFITAYPVWDATNLYVFCDVVDGVIVDIPANPGWNQDAIELYFDGTNDHTTETALKAGQYQFTFPHWMKGTEAGRLGSVFGTTFDTAGVAFKIKDHDMRSNAGILTVEGSGYNLEVKIPLAALGIDGSTAGAKLGFEVQLDNSNLLSAGRQGMEKWWSASNNSWANAALWGYAKLGATISVGVNEKQPSVVNSYRLEQNYPNPFNPSTRITYSVPKSEKVRLAVYNLLGSEVAMLVNETKGAGTYTVNFNAQNLSSGVYFYKLETGNTLLVKKMMLLK
jgi:hypothetical protein